MIIFGGIKCIVKVVESFVLLMVLLYLVVVLYIVVINYVILFDIFQFIFFKVFEFEVVVGGFFGVMVFMVMMMGIKCGLFFNEVGMGLVLNVVVVLDVKYFVN